MTTPERIAVATLVTLGSLWLLPRDIRTGVFILLAYAVFIAVLLGGAFGLFTLWHWALA